MQEQTLQTADIEIGQIRQIVERLLTEAETLTGERRSLARKPYFRPVSLVMQEIGKQQSFSCFSRDISPHGIGLLHNMPLEPSEVVLTIRTESAGDVRLSSEIMWCRPCGEGWFISGAKFRSILPAK